LNYLGLKKNNILKKIRILKKKIINIERLKSVRNIFLFFAFCCLLLNGESKSQSWKFKTSDDSIKFFLESSDKSIENPKLSIEYGKKAL